MLLSTAAASHEKMKKQDSSSSGFASMDSDVVYVILMRVDPSSIFQCILVCKLWLQLITGISFRRDYMAVWKGHPNLLVGFFKYYPLLYRFIVSSKSPSIKLLAMSKLGLHIIDKTRSVQCIGNFISKSAGLMLSVHMQHRALFVCNIFSDAEPLCLPPPSDFEYRETHVASILSCNEGFKVILARAGKVPNHHVHIQTFCSWTRKWDRSTLTCSKQIAVTTTMLKTVIYSDGMYIEAGLMTRGAVVYWRVHSDNNLRGIAVYDCSRRNNEVGFVPELRENSGHYGLSPQGSLWCATWRYDWKMAVINIWAVDENDNEKSWKMLYSLDVNSMWAKNLAVLAPLFGARPKLPFGFLSFVPERSDCIYVAMENEIFVYHINTQKLERIQYYCRDQLKEFDYIRLGGSYQVYHPLTMEELGVWPSSPSSLQAAFC